ncbi:hypothetical protein [Saccharothrix longispora]|uniref:hypothetical protein n=1 Tax=Saccharothrix longispora TaxID=33920 RepID=UPI0028FD5195|nr:hypothetical protein [Saccharothrix longispora]MBY8850830.1 hypothetical protein [Saccharothrix sp. MB29]MDU0294435.1 hypothetical protein [Saccharothrix longispora]
MSAVVARLLRPATQRTYEKVFGLAYVALGANALLTAGCAPLLLALAVVRDPVASWPFFVVLSGCCAPALAGVFGCFAALDGGLVWRPFTDAYRRAAGRALVAWYGGAALLVVLVVDVVVVSRTAWGPAVVPLFATAAVLVVGTVVAVLVAASTGTDRLRDLVWPCLCLVARRWYLALANAVVLGLAAAAVLLQPVAGLLVACAPLLYAVYANTRVLLAGRAR